LNPSEARSISGQYTISLASKVGVAVGAAEVGRTIQYSKVVVSVTRRPE
jgi:hypothetical protein